MLHSMHGVVYNCGPCPYLPGREFLAFHPQTPVTTAGQYRRLMDLRFRRSGSHLYLPVCQGCDACQPVRIDVAAFRPARDQRRCLARNRDLTVEWHERSLDAERLALYRRYQRCVHKAPISAGDARFLVDDGGIPGGELHARDADGRLLAVSICDVFEDALSSVYCYYDPDQRRRSLGTYMALAEITHAAHHQLPWWYLGFLVRDCGKMSYKARFRPHEVLEGGAWVRYS